jgi:hypothetical protein
MCGRILSRKALGICGCGAKGKEEAGCRKRIDWLLWWVDAGGLEPRGRWESQSWKTGGRGIPMPQLPADITDYLACLVSRAELLAYDTYSTVTRLAGPAKSSLTSLPPGARDARGQGRGRSSYQMTFCPHSHLVLSLSLPC